MDLPEFEDVKKAAQRLKGNTLKTPLIRSDVIDIISEKNVWFKPECSQKVGAFKYRGAYNRLSVMSDRERCKGVVAFSSGNHAQGISRAASELGISAIIVMPADAPAIKVDGVNNDGGEIVFYDRATENREAIAHEIASDQGRVLVPAYDDPYIIAGQGTVGLEICQEAQSKGLEFDALVTPIGGGGLCAGTSLAMQAMSPQTKIFAAEPENYDDHRMSLYAGERVGLLNAPPTICDALMTAIPGELTFSINKYTLSEVFQISDRDCLLAMAIASNELGVRLEPGGAVAMAAVLTGALKNYSNLQTIAIILSGGNADPEIINRANAFLA